MSFYQLRHADTFEALIKGTIMSAIYILISISFIVAIGFLAAFIWSIRNGQYEDDYSPSVRMLKDDSKPNDRPKL